MDETDEMESRWNEAETWGELLSLNAQYIRRSREGNEKVTAPFYYGPREDCIGSSDHNIQSLLDFHKYGILSTQGSTRDHEFEENVREGAIEYRQWRTVPWMEFIIRDKERKTVPFITKMLEDEILTISVLDGFTGEPCFGTENRGTTLEISRSAKEKAALQRAKWEVKRTTPKVATLEDFHLEDVKAIQNERIYICLVALRIEDSVLHSAKDTRFLQEVNKIDLPHEILRCAKLTKMRSLRQRLLGHLWVGRGLFSVGRSDATEAVLKPTGGLSVGSIGERLGGKPRSLARVP